MKAVPQAWQTAFAPTWLASHDACEALDRHVATLVARRLARPSTAEELLAIRFARIRELLLELGPQPQHAVHCTLALALGGELLLCADEGGILREETAIRFAAGDDQRELEANVIRLLRNAICHPAAAPESVALADLIESSFRDEPFAFRLRHGPGRLADRQVTLFALRIIDNIGRHQARRWRVVLRGAAPRP